MLAALIIAGVILLTLGSVGKRLLDLNKVPILVWVALLASGAAPAYVGYKVLNPGEVVDSADVKAQRDEVTLDVPEGYAILVTATLNEDYDEDAPNVNTTAYSLNLKGEGWAESASGTIRRKTAGGGPDIDLTAGQGISEAGKKRSGKWGEDLQDRIDLKHSGTVEVHVTNWQGLAAAALTLDVVPGPPSGVVVWSIVAVLSLLGIVFEVRYGIERVAGDLGFLTLWAVFLRDGVTPLDDFQRVGYAVLPAALLGWGAVAGIAWVVVKYTSSKEVSEPEAEPEPEPDVEKKGRRRRRRRSEDSGE